jgi:hypothetical protein
MKRFRPPKRPFRLRAPEPSEGEFHKSVAQWLDWMLMPPALYTTFPAGWGKMDKATAGRLRGSGLKPGFPDILVFHGGRCVGIELKVGKNAESEEQLVMFPLLKAAGVNVYVCRSIDEVFAALRWENFPMRKRLEAVA